MKSKKYDVNFPTIDEFMTICVVILNGMQIQKPKLRKSLFHQLTKMWENMYVESLVRYDVSNVARNIFFIATGTGILCWKCMQFDFHLEGESHFKVCFNQGKKDIKHLDALGLKQID